MMAPISITLTPIRDGKLFPLGVTTARRSTLLPEVPTIAEAGVAGFDFPIWYGIWAPAGTPTGVVDKLSKDIARVLAGRDLRDWIAKHGGEPMSMTQPEFARFVQSESESCNATHQRGWDKALGASHGEHPNSGTYFPRRGRLKAYSLLLGVPGLLYPEPQ